MDILIDNQKVVSVEADLLQDEDGDLRVVLGMTQMAHVLDTWMKLDESRRGYCYGDDQGAATIIIARCDTPNGALVIEDVEPFWNGSYAVAGYSLGRLASALPADALRWGEAIGEPDPLAGAR